jgi:hypothetical protein
LLAIKLLLIVIAANSAPVLACKLLGDRWDTPVDMGIKLADGNPLFGPSKTWRGLAAAILLGGLVAFLLGWSPLIGMLMAGASMLGDLLSSFIKRRMSKASSSRVLGLDQIPESLLPLLLGSYLLGYSWKLAILLSVLFMLLAIITSPILYRLGIRNRPH